jgi:hypothetical protein
MQTNIKKQPPNNFGGKEFIIYDDYNGLIRADQQTIGTITANIAKAGALRTGWKVIERVSKR